MTDQRIKQDNPNSTGTYGSLSRSLVVWFLVLSLVPLSIISLIGYWQSNQSLSEAANNKLQTTAELQVEFISNWFHYRFMDLNNQAELSKNGQLLEDLINGWKNSNKTLPEYVKSYDWAKRVDGTEESLINFSIRYDYIFDLYLIDSNGNILYTVASEVDLGSNIFTGENAKSNLSKSVRVTLDTGENQFSDLEEYNASTQNIASFITAPLLDEWGTKIGVFAIQLRLDRIFQLLSSANEKTTRTDYLLNQTGLLMTPIVEEQSDDVLNRYIKTDQFLSWFNEHYNEGEEADESEEEKAFEYIGPEGRSVIGVHHSFKIKNVTWLLISEIDSIEAFGAAKFLAATNLGLMALAAALIVLFSVNQARRITRPLVALSSSAMKVAAGEAADDLSVRANNEIGKLSDSFTHMVQMRNTHERALHETNALAEQALLDLKEQKFALDQHAIVAITDVQGTITFANEKFCEISGYDESELVGENHRIIKSEEHSNDFFKDMYRILAHGEVWNGEICNKAKDGHLYWVHSTIVPFLGKDNKPISYIAIRTDITKRKLDEQELIVAKEKAELAVSAKSEFLATMSHEIRTPMNGVLGMLGLLLNSSLNSEQEHRVEIAQSSAKSLLVLINDILDFSKVEAGKLDLEILSFNLRGMLGEFAESMAHQAQAKDLELILDVVGVEASMVMGDPGRIRQVLANLVGNAIKFTSSGEIIIDVNLVEFDENNWRLSCQIKDTGIGIPKDKVEFLFDAFSQVDASTTRQFGGTGLGLAIVNKLCEVMGGDIRVTSDPGKGSNFSFHILVGKSDKSQVTMPKVDISKLNLLIVDDNDTNREVLRGQLEHWGASVTEACDGAEALKICEQLSFENKSPMFDIGLLDMQMPGMDGAELGSIFKKDVRFNNMKLIMMTSMSFRGDATMLAAHGFSGYFPKPATTSDLFDALNVVAEDGEALKLASPLVTHHYLQTLNQTSETAYTGKFIKSTRILLVEDNQINQLVASGILEEFGLSAVCTANGLEAIDSLSAAPDDAPFNLILMDCQMPEMDGFEATRQIRSGAAGSRYNSVPIVAMTANAMLGDREKCLASGMSDYLAKPIEQHLLHEKLEEWLPESLQAAQTIGVSDSTADDSDSSASKSENAHSDKLEAQLLDEADNFERPLSVWDDVAALKRVMGKEKLLITLLNIYIAESPERMKQLDEAASSGAIDQVRHFAHTIKGVAANLSALRLQKVATELEFDATNNTTNRFSELAEQIISEDKQLSQIFEGYLEGCKNDSSSNPGGAAVGQGELHQDELAETCSALLVKLKQSDFIDTEELDLLVQRITDSNLKSLFEQLTESVSQFDSENAIELLEEISQHAGFILRGQA